MVEAQQLQAEETRAFAGDKGVEGVGEGRWSHDHDVNKQAARPSCLSHLVQAECHPVKPLAPAPASRRYRRGEAAVCVY